MNHRLPGPACLLSALLGTCLLVACGVEAPGDRSASRPPTGAAGSAAADASEVAGAPVSATGRVSEWVLPAGPGSAQPDLVLAPSGDVLLSWVEAVDGGHRLRFSRSLPEAATGWQPVSTVAEGRGWFVNWADTPHMYALPDGSLWAHWLRSTGPDRMDYGIELVHSDDGGARWSEPRLVHPAGGRGDHGFVSFWTQAPDRLGIAWLDSRQKSARAMSAAGAAAGPHDAHHGGSAAMMLRAAVHGPGGAQEREWPLDVSTCDCCTTDSAMTDRGAVVVYRGRDADEIRDTRIVRFDGEAWTAPREVYRDGWRIPGCPVNGPVVAARGHDVWVAWYTEAGGVPELRAAHSADAGDHFGPMVSLAKGPGVLGRLALTLDDAGQPVLAWLEQHDATTQVLRLGRYGRAWTDPRRQDVARVSARGRASGLPRLQWAQGRAWLVWTDVVDGAPVLRGAQVR